MAIQQMDAVSSFVHLTDNIPSWLERLAALSNHAAEKNSEFVADYAKIVSQIRPKRVKSPSLQSIHSNVEESVHLSQIDPQNENTLPTPPAPILINPLEAGNKYLYAQAQKKRKPGSSVRSGASGPQKFRNKNQVVIYYDSHMQTELDAMVKAVGVARNNLRKGRNALNASQKFPLPTLSRRHDSSSLNPSAANIRSQSISRPVLSGKYNLRSSTQSPAKDDEACFVDVDKMLETVQGLYETAAHQFLRDGDCKTELDSARVSLSDIIAKAVPTTEMLKGKARAQEAAEAEDDNDSEATLNSPPVNINMSNKMAPSSISQTLEDMKTRAVTSLPAIPSLTDPNLPTAGMTIEVDDDDSEDDSVTDVDVSQFRLNAARHMRV